MEFRTQTQCSEWWISSNFIIIITFLIEISILMVFGNSLKFFRHHVFFPGQGPTAGRSTVWAENDRQCNSTEGNATVIFVGMGIRVITNIPIAEMDLLGLLKRYVLEQKHRFQIWQGQKLRFKKLCRVYFGVDGQTLNTQRLSLKLSNMMVLRCFLDDFILLAIAGFCRIS